MTDLLERTKHARDVGGGNGSGLHRALGGRGMPITAFYDPGGRLVDVWNGVLVGGQLQERLHTLFGITT